MGANEFALLNRLAETFGIRYPVFSAGMEYRTGYSFDWIYSTPHRVIPNREKWNLLRFMGGGARSIDKPKMARKLSLSAGQGVVKIDRVMPASERFAELAAGLQDHCVAGLAPVFDGADCSAIRIARPPLSHEM